MNTPVNFEIAKLLKDKGFDEKCQYFYTKPNSKMFGLDEHGNCYPIKNITKRLYIVNKHAALNAASVYIAPTISDVVIWIFEKYEIWISVSYNRKDRDWDYEINYNRPDEETIKEAVNKAIDRLFDRSSCFSNISDAYSAAIIYVLTNLI